MGIVGQGLLGTRLWVRLPPAAAGPTSRRAHPGRTSRGWLPWVPGVVEPQVPEEEKNRARVHPAEDKDPGEGLHTRDAGQQCPEGDNGRVRCSDRAAAWLPDLGCWKKMLPGTLAHGRVAPGVSLLGHRTCCLPLYQVPHPRHCRPMRNCGAGATDLGPVGTCAARRHSRGRCGLGISSTTQGARRARATGQKHKVRGKRPRETPQRTLLCCMSCTLPCSASAGDAGPLSFLGARCMSPNDRGSAGTVDCGLTDVAS
ncbi:uncharacterized protein LOC121489692 [Vulpes lagopus]|uniref:uncharacterized protein LOC121489692 n=1 Tax=Vulpes lagopus TaxID=494514 RepID=UPI001BC94F72|nr:uncharacterized protein LOC121489692 [Vulpes lagopus]